MVTRESYESRKSKLSAQLRQASNVRLAKSTSNLFRHRKSSNEHFVDVRHFNNVIAIDPTLLTADVEGMTTYETLVEETLKFGFLPTVVPEFKTITVGGATTGIGLEAASFKYGLVHETVLEMDVLLSSGDVVTCSRISNPDLFFGFANSYGTLGYALRLRIQLIRTMPFVEVTHKRFHDFATYFNEIKSTCSKPVDFIDGTIFSENEMYITTGIFVQSAPDVSDYTYLQIYYQSIRSRRKDYMTTLQFIWRWDTDWYWGSKKFGAQNKLVRYLLGPKRLRSSYYWKLRARLNQTPFWDMLALFTRYETIVQDIEIPIESAAEFMDFQMKQIGITPVWACPINTFDKQVTYPLYPMSPNTTYVNLGFWDIVRTKHEDGYYNRLIEKKVTQLQGRKILYSDSYYSPESFDSLYGGAFYTELKKKYDPHSSFRTMYEKCVIRPN